MVLTVILTILLFVILIIPHEFGHFIVAKACGVQVNEFSMGMGPLLWQKKGEETEYSIRLIPIGGFCAMEGENEESDNPRAFNNKRAWQKLLVLIAGAAMNVLVAILVMIIAYTAMGFPTNTLSEVTAGGPAERAGIAAGDTITAINGRETTNWNDTVSYISETAEGDDVEITVQRNGESMTMSVTPELTDDDRLVVGIQADLDHDILRGAKYGTVGTWEMFKLEMQAFGMLFTGKIGRDEVSGPVGMIKLVNETTEYGFVSFLYLVALISLNLAIINLLPLPALDGGRILFVIIRKITGNMISDELEGRIHLIGMSILLILFVFITWNDIINLFK